jgi:RIO kinase 1
MRQRLGRREHEAAWRNAKVNALYKLIPAGMRVPTPYGYFKDTLIMEPATDAAHPLCPGVPDVADGR